MLSWILGDQLSDAVKWALIIGVIGLIGFLVFKYFMSQKNRGEGNMPASSKGRSYRGVNDGHDIITDNLESDIVW